MENCQKICISFQYFLLFKKQLWLSRLTSYLCKFGLLYFSPNFLNLVINTVGTSSWLLDLSSCYGHWLHCCYNNKIYTQLSSWTWFHWHQKAATTNCKAIIKRHEENSKLPFHKHLTGQFISFCIIIHRFSEYSEYAGEPLRCHF